MDIIRRRTRRPIYHKPETEARDEVMFGRDQELHGAAQVQDVSQLYAPDAIHDSDGGFVEHVQDNGYARELDHVMQLGNKYLSDDVPMFYESDYVPPEQMYRSSYQSSAHQNIHFSNSYEGDTQEQRFSIVERWQYIMNGSRFSLSFAVSGLLILLLLGAISFVSSGLHLKGRVLGVSEEAYSSLEEALQSVKQQDFEASSMNFREANAYFTAAASDFQEWGGFLTNADITIPLLSKITTGKYALEAGKYLTSAGEEMNVVISQVALLENPFDQNAEISLLDTYKKIIVHLEASDQELALAEAAINKVKVSDLPEDKREEFILLRDTLPQLRSNIGEFVGNSDAFIDTFGGNGPRKFLFLFQNNHELRATGGFIGSYGLLDINDGTVRKFFVDGVFNPDGQLSVDVIPPKPIQKISAGWSLHDSNWFADFPVSAEKAMFFYEKTGGPTVDGVIAVTPVILQRFLEITGPIYLEEYDISIDAENFIEHIQYKVEVDYDKEENRPKKILADLAPILLERVFQFNDLDTMIRTLDVIHSSVQEKHIVMYAKNEDLQQLYHDMGWSGEVKEAPHDYLSVVHTNINGYKTDGVINEEISHEATIQDNGHIRNTVTITREHLGGDTGYEWWDKVNADYMRVYVPLGSILISAEGHTREYNEDPLDYAALGFQTDDNVAQQERSVSRDPETGTYIFEESGKTVFGNWVYVSPKETVTVRYTYELPFTIDPQKVYDTADSYSLLVQKQSGTMGASLRSRVRIPEEWSVEWNYPDPMEAQDDMWVYEDTLNTDVFSALVFKKD